MICEAESHDSRQSLPLIFDAPNSLTDALLILQAQEVRAGFPHYPLYCTEQEARAQLSQHGSVFEEEPGSDSTIAQKLLTAATSETLISIGIWNGRVRFTNYRTKKFNQNDDLKGRKLGWFVEYYGGSAEFDEPLDTGFIVLWRNQTKKILIVFGLHLGPVRVIDEDPSIGLIPDLATLVSFAHDDSRNNRYDSGGRPYR